MVKLPFSNLDQGSIPARNYIFDWSIERGDKRHWLMDDNISEFARLNNNKRKNVYSGQYFQAMEDFTDRYENIAFSGPNGKGFTRDNEDRPFSFNKRVYSCTLINNDLKLRWRGRYNEDTDLILRAFKLGWSSILFYAFLMQKNITAFAKGKAMPGGNTDNVYTDNDYRLKFAESLKEQHPDCVDVVWKFNRWHHQVNYDLFKDNKHPLKKGIVRTERQNEYGMELVRSND